jgi:hypothetical protein
MTFPLIFRCIVVRSRKSPSPTWHAADHLLPLELHHSIIITPIMKDVTAITPVPFANFYIILPKAPAL